MTKIKDYLADSTVSKTDKLIGTDSVDNTTKTYTVESLGNFIQKLPTPPQSLDGAAVNVVSESSKIVVLTHSGSEIIVVNLHSAVDNDGLIYNIVSENGNTITIDPFEGELIDRTPTLSVSNKATLLASNGNWYTI